MVHYNTVQPCWREWRGELPDESGLAFGLLLSAGSSSSSTGYRKQKLQRRHCNNRAGLVVMQFAIFLRLGFCFCVFGSLCVLSCVACESESARAHVIRLLYILACGGMMLWLQVPFSIPFPHQPRNSYSTSLGNICFGTSCGYNITTSCGYNITWSFDCVPIFCFLKFSTSLCITGCNLCSRWNRT